ncbi:MAG TPA: hypothetical protein VIJ96_15875 [Acidothermaceae bacterium]
MPAKGSVIEADAGGGTADAEAAGDSTVADDEDAGDDGATTPDESAALRP